MFHIVRPSPDLPEEGGGRPGSRRSPVAHFIDFGSATVIGGPGWSTGDVSNYVKWSQDGTMPNVQILPEVLINSADATPWNQISGGYFIGSTTDCPNRATHNFPKQIDLKPNDAYTQLGRATLSPNNQVNPVYSTDIDSYEIRLTNPTNPDGSTNPDYCAIGG
jgi:hypothetical protein